MARRYSKKASRKVEQTMRERKEGTLRSGSTGRKVTSRKQAIAIGLSEARREGAEVPERGARGKRTRKAAGRTKTAARTTAAGSRKTAARATTAGRKRAA